MPVPRSRRRRAVALLAGTAVAGGCVVVTAPAPAHADPSDCAATFNLFIPGTWETDEHADPSRPVGMLAPVAEALQRAHGAAAEVYTLPYMARAFDNGHTYADSKADALRRAEHVLSTSAERCPGTRFTITGYSQGADAAGDLAAAIGHHQGPIPAERVLAVGLLADPRAGTDGAVVVGPPASGDGIADPRPQGMGALSGRVASICDPGDLYCSIDKGSNPLLGSLGSILSTTPGAANTDGPADGATAVATALTSDFTRADLPALGANLGALGRQLTSPTVDLQHVSRLATTLRDTLTPLAELLDSGAANPAATGRLTATAPDSAEHDAAQVLDRAHRADLTGALTALTTIADTATTLLDTGASTVPAHSPQIQTLTSLAGPLDGQLAPLTSTPAETLSAAPPVLSVLKPTVVLDQVLTVATGLSALDVPAIVHNLTVLPQKVAALDARGAHQIAGELNNQFAPLVTMAAGVDLTWVSQMLAVIPDPSGVTQIAALVTSILANVDIIRLATLVGQIQEIAWTALEKLLPPPGQAPDPVGAGAVMTGLLPVGLDLASVAVTMLSGKATQTPPELLGKHHPTDGAITTPQRQNPDLPALAGSLTTIAESRSADDLRTLVGDGLEAASFFTSGAHTNYQSLVVDNAGRTALTWLIDWLNLQIGRAA
ncbi:cutinase family protein [Rhodococcus aetherivorans]|uniref:cutinase family protein n=1 Tax=Rhodococcus aetherivorans TaxID=191292 RepID=UPI001639BD84|nr:cutinase family protein [Rhodococcus aetherivorans]MBC2592497.1 cutinase family protein [Rhodococcus aetherivorans]